MVMRKRIPETDVGIQGELSVEVFNKFAKYMRDKGWIETKDMINAGVNTGHVLEIGCGPDIKGLEWLKNTKNTRLTALEISKPMIKLAKINAQEYGLVSRVKYIHKNATHKYEFEDNTFDAAFSNGSLHEWEFPINVFNELFRVVKPNGIIFVSDMRRDVSKIMEIFVRISTKPKEILPGFKSSLNASYTVEELKEIIEQTDIKDYNVLKEPFGLSIIGKKH